MRSIPKLTVRTMAGRVPGVAALEIEQDGSRSPRFGVSALHLRDVSRQCAALADELERGYVGAFYPGEFK